VVVLIKHGVAPWEAPVATRGDRWVENPRGYGVNRSPLNYLVAGAGYAEHYTASETHWIDLK